MAVSISPRRTTDAAANPLGYSNVHVVDLIPITGARITLGSAVTVLPGQLTTVSVRGLGEAGLDFEFRYAVGTVQTQQVGNFTVLVANAIQSYPSVQNFGKQSDEYFVGPTTPGTMVSYQLVTRDSTGAIDSVSPIETYTRP